MSNRINNLTLTGIGVQLLLFILYELWVIRISFYRLLHGDEGNDSNQVPDNTLYLSKIISEKFKQGEERLLRR